MVKILKKKRKKYIEKEKEYYFSDIEKNPPPFVISRYKERGQINILIYLQI